MKFRIIIDNNPANNKIDLNYLYYEGDSDYMLDNVRLDMALGEAGQLQFTIYTNHPNYNLVEMGYKHVYAYVPNETYPDLPQRGDVLFNGVISEISRDIYNTLTVYCTGVLGLLNYSIQPQKKYSTTAQSYVAQVIEEHNDQVEQNVGSFYNFLYPSVEGGTTEILRYTNYETTLECLRRDIMEPLGLYPRLKYDYDFVYKYPKIEFVSLENFGKLSTQPIRIGENLIKYGEDTAMDDVYTAVIPLGKKKTESERTSTDVKALDAYVDIRTVNNNSPILVNDTGVATYGFKCAVVHFEDITVPSNLKTRAAQWLQAQVTAKMRFTLTALDLSESGANYDAFRVGDRVNCYITTTRNYATLPIYEMTIYPNEPEKNTLTVGANAPTSTNTGGSSNLRPDEEAMDTLGELLRIGQYQATYSVNAGQSVNITNADFNAVTPDGYTPIAVSRISSGNANALIRSFNPATASTSTVVQLRNIGSTNLTNQTCAITVLYAKSKVLAS